MGVAKRESERERERSKSRFSGPSCKLLPLKYCVVLQCQYFQRAETAQSTCILTDSLKHRTHVTPWNAHYVCANSRRVSKKQLLRFAIKGRRCLGNGQVALSHSTQAITSDRRAKYERKGGRSAGGGGGGGLGPKWGWDRTRPKFPLPVQYDPFVILVGVGFFFLFFSCVCVCLCCVCVCVCVVFCLLFFPAACTCVYGDRINIICACRNIFGARIY